MAFIEPSNPSHTDTASKARPPTDYTTFKVPNLPTVSGLTPSKDGISNSTRDEPHIPGALTFPNLSWIEQELHEARLADEQKEKRRAEEEMDERREKSREAIFASYHKHAMEEDKELVDGWNENLNILLTFVSYSQLFLSIILTDVSC